MKTSRLSTVVLITITTGAWAVLGAHLVWRFLRPGAFLAVLAASVTGVLIVVGERIVGAIRALTDATKHGAADEVIAVMTRAREVARIDAAEARSTPLPGPKSWSDTGPFPAIHGAGQN